MISLLVNLALIYFSFKFVLWLYGFTRDKEEPQLLINNIEQKIDPKPLILPPDPKINLSLDNIDKMKDTNFKNLLAKEARKIRRKHLSIRVNYT
jgi:hypothetical protein